MQTVPKSTYSPVEIGTGETSDAMPEDIAENIRQALRGLQFGEITITVRNGNVIQIDRIARRRQFKSNNRE